MATSSLSQAHFNENEFERVPQVITEDSAAKLKVAVAASDDLPGFSVIDCLPHYLLEGATLHESLRQHARTRLELN